MGSGLGGSFGMADENTHGTYVAPDRHYRVKKAEVKRKKTTVQGGGLAAGELVQPGSFRVVTARAAEGSIELEVPNTKFGRLLKHIFGHAVTPVQQGATTAYLQTYNLMDNLGKFFSAQNGIPTRTGAVTPYTMTGTKVTSVEFSCEKNGLLTCTIEMDGRDETESQTLAAPSYPSGQWPFSFKDLTVKAGATVGTETVIDGITKVSVKFERGMDTEAFYAGGAGLKSEQVGNEYVKISGSIEADYLNKADFVDRFNADSQTSLVFAWVSQTLAGAAFPFSLELDITAAFFDDGTPTLDGPDIVSGSFPFVGQSNLVDPPIRAKYVSTDVTA